ncbi:MAG: protein kinase [Candidatus Promineifilaceae bacterium]|nr:protein kinase [Candidatus Promineifilaceae bacterium]
MDRETVRARGYELLDPIGSGGFGVVYQARQLTVGRLVAIKIVAADAFDDPRAMALFAQEAHIAAQLEHPHIVPLYDFWQHEGNAYLVMRWLAGGNLAQALIDGPWPADRAVRLVDQVAAALSKAHNASVVHRDLKPANILLDEAGNAYLGDFGIAQLLTGHDLEADLPRVLGSLAYMAPEQARGQPVTAQADLYSLALIVYELLTGQPAVTATDPAAILYHHLHETVPLISEENPSLPPALDVVLQQATAKDPSKRHSDILAFAESVKLALQQPDLVGSSAQRPATEPVPHNLPFQSTAFVGRRDELASLVRLLDGSRLVTILGPGGAGKTRLALAVADHLVDRAAHDTPYPDGVFFVPLDDLNSSEQILPATARSLGFRLRGAGAALGEPGQSLKAQLMDHLAGRRLLLIMDNFEHLLDGASLLAQIGTKTAAVDILITSRERLGLPGEQLLRLHGMPVPSATAARLPLERLLGEYAACRMFLEAARRAAPDLELGQEDVGHMIQICRRLEGLPLALELAAGWAGMLPIAAIAREIERGLSLMETSAGHVPQRQRSIQTVFDSTWRQLDAPERTLFVRLSVFEGGFTRQAAEAVTEATLGRLQSLLNKSMLQFDRQTNRYRLHRLLRYYGSRQLTGDPAIEAATRRQHSAYFNRFLATRAEAIVGPEVNGIIEELEPESENLRLAWQWACDHRHLERMEQALECLMRFYFNRRRSDDLAQAVDRGLAAVAAVDSPKARLLEARLKIWQGATRSSAQQARRCEEALIILHDEALSELDIRPVLAQAKYTLGKSLRDSDSQRCRQLLTESITLYEELGDRLGAAWARGELALTAYYAGDYQQATALYRDSLAVLRQAGKPNDVIWIVSQMGQIAGHLGYAEEAEAQLRDYLAWCRRTGEVRKEVSGLFWLSYVLRFAGKYEEMRRLMAQAGILTEESRSQGKTLWAPEMQDLMRAWINVHLGNYEGVGRLVGPWTELFAGTGSAEAGHGTFLRGYAALAQGEIARAVALFDEALAINEQAEYQRFLEMTLGPTSIACAAAGDLPRARDLLQRSLQLAADTHSFEAAAHSLVAAAALAHYQERPAAALTLWTAAARHPMVANSAWFVDVAGQAIETEAERLPAETADAARRAGQGRELWTTVQELLNG